jgi:hypothetical protein
MDIFDPHGRMLSQLLILNQDVEKIPVNLIKDVVFIDTKNYMYYPMISHIFNISSDKKTIFITNIIEVFKKLDKKNLSDLKYTSGLYKNLIEKDYKNMPRDMYNDILYTYLNPSEERTKKIISNIMSLYTKIDQNVKDYMNQFVDIKSPGITDRWSQESISSLSSEDSFILSEDSFSSGSEDSESPKVVPIDKTKKFTEDVMSYTLVLTEKKDISIDLKEVYRNFKLDNTYVSVGYDNKFRSIQKKDKDRLKYIDRFKKLNLKPFFLHFLYYTKFGEIYGRLNSKGVLSIEMKFKSLQIDDFMSDTTYEQISTGIYERLKKNTGLRKSIQPYGIKIRVVYKNGYLPPSRIEEFYKGTQQKNNVVRFELKLKDGVQIKNIFYSIRDEEGRFSIKLPNKKYIDDVLKNIAYVFTHYSSEIVKKEKIKKKKIIAKEIHLDKRNCQKERQIEIQKDPDQEGDSILKYRGYTLKCEGPIYTWPGFTTQGSACCFKKNQKGKQLYKQLMREDDDEDNDDEDNDDEKTLQDDASKIIILNIEPLHRDDTNMGRFRRGVFSNEIVKNIFSDRDYYSLSAGLGDVSLTQIIEFIYGDSIINDSIKSININNYYKYNIDNEKSYEDWVIDKKSPESLVRSVSHHKEINLIVILQTDDGTKINCSITDFFIYKKFLVILCYKGNHRVLIKTKNKSIQYQLPQDDKNIQRLIKTYNEYCNIIENCDQHILSLKEILSDSSIIVNGQIVNSLNLVYYISSDSGIIPIKPSKIDTNIKLIKIKDIELLGQTEQYDKLKELSKKYEYLSPEKITINSADKITGIELKCGIIVPVKMENYSLDLPKSEQNFYIGLDEQLQSEIMDDELDIFKENLEDNYVIIAKNSMIDYFKTNIPGKNDIIQMSGEGNYDGIISFILKLIIEEKKDLNKTTLPIESIIPLNVNHKVYVDVVSRIAWEIINKKEDFFEDKHELLPITMRFIPDMDEIPIDDFINDF